MHLASVYSGTGTPSVQAAVFYDGKYYLLSDLGVPFRTLQELLEAGDAGLRAVSSRIPQALSGVTGWSPDKVRLAAPLHPRQGICIGKNYRLHVQGGGEMKMPSQPIAFLKTPGCFVGSGDEICIPSIVECPDFEAELAVVIGKRGKNIPEADAMKYVFGYTGAHDVSARDHQLGTKDFTNLPPLHQWTRGKTFDTFCPLGPHIVTADEIEDPHELRIQCLRDGKVVQDTHGKERETMHFRIPHLIHWLSQGHTLEAGDVILTGTPSGTAMELPEKPWMKPGETYTVRIGGIGDLTNTVVFEAK